MFSRILSGAFYGIDSYPVQVEVDVAPGLPCMEMVGCLSREAGEAKQRIRVALRNIGVRMPPSRITINLSPADRYKGGTAFDLPSAIGLLVSMGILKQEKAADILFAGELGLNGELRPVRGILPIVRAAAKAGIDRCVVPEENGQEAAVTEGVTVYGASHLSQVVSGLREGMEAAGLSPVKAALGKTGADNADDDCSAAGRRECGAADIIPDFADISGQETARRAAEIAVAGCHHLLLIGPPGSGKTMIAERLPGIMPPLSPEESLEVSAIYSVSGRLPGGRLLQTRPFLAPHHTATGASLIGGGRIPMPGAVSLAHRGVLFLDELSEFRRSVLDMLRQPLEERKVRIARTYGNLEYPAAFMLAGAMNPCPCGYYPDEGLCRCSQSEIRRYLGRVSGPVLDRIDLCVETQKPDTGKLFEQIRGEDSASIRRRVTAARDIQKKRFGTGLRFNGDMNAGEIAACCVLDRETQRQFRRAAEAFSMSMRVCHKVLRTARTIADLAGAAQIELCHVNEAVYYRAAVSTYWERKG